MKIARDYLLDRRIAYLRNCSITSENGRTKIYLRPVRTLKYAIDRMNEEPTD
jgi:hypothetical protein